MVPKELTSRLWIHGPGSPPHTPPLPPASTAYDLGNFLLGEAHGVVQWEDHMARHEAQVAYSLEGHVTKRSVAPGHSKAR